MMGFVRRGAGVLAILLGLAMPELAAAAQGTAAAPVFTPKPGKYTAPLTVTIATATAGATTYYTLDGSSPSRQKSPVYKGPLKLTATATLKAFAYKPGLKGSAITSGAYVLSAPPPPPPPPPPPSETGGTLFLASLTPQTGAASSGSGSSTLTLTRDQTAAVLRFSFSGLTGPITSQHIHAADGTILFDIDTTRPQADGSRVWRIQPAGTFDTARILAMLRVGECYLNLHTAAFPAGEIKGFFRQSSGSQAFTPPPAPPALPPGPPTQEDAARFLFQATYGPRPGEVEALQQKGFARWLDEQMALPTVSHLATYDQLLVATGEEPSPGLVRESFFAQAVQGPDQLRQRVTFALSELFVVSDRDAEVRNNPDGLAGYLDLLAQHSFGNFRELLEAVTLSPAMGAYLDMAGSSKSIPERGLNPNENYAREILQLFSIGLYELHPDGTLRLDAGNQPIPTYDQETVKAFARAFTGWTLGGQNQSDPRRFFRPVRHYRAPMEPWAVYHAADEKRLLGGAVLPAGQSAQTDLEQALDAVFQHPNTGPFLLPLPDSAAGDQQPQPGVRLPLRTGVRQQRRRDLGGSQGGGARHPARLRGAGGGARHTAGRRAPARAGGAPRGAAAHSRRPAAHRPVALPAPARSGGAEHRPDPAARADGVQLLRARLRAAGGDRAGGPRLAGVPDRHRDHGRRRRQPPSRAARQWRAGRTVHLQPGAVPAAAGADRRGPPRPRRPAAVRRLDVRRDARHPARRPRRPWLSAPGQSTRAEAALARQPGSRIRGPEVGGGR